MVAQDVLRYARWEGWEGAGGGLVERMRYVCRAASGRKRGHTMGRSGCWGDHGAGGGIGVRTIGGCTARGFVVVVTKMREQKGQIIMAIITYRFCNRRPFFFVSSHRRLSSIHAGALMAIGVLENRSPIRTMVPRKKCQFAQRQIEAHKKPMLSLLLRAAHRLSFADRRSSSARNTSMPNWVTYSPPHAPSLPAMRRLQLQLCKSKHPTPPP